MNFQAQSLLNPLKTLTLAVTVAATLTSCVQPQTQQPQAIRIDGSSTVYPITQKIVEEFNATQQAPVEVTVDFSGTGGGFQKFCAGETDINNASRPIQQAEMDACKQAGVAYIELPVAFDALTVVVHPQNTWAQDITLAELKKIWEPSAQRTITRWNQVRPNWPDQPLSLYGPGADSGTFDYFTEAVIGEAQASRKDYNASEDDEVIEKGVSTDPNALGYFGFAYYEANQQEVKALAIDAGKGPVMPSREAVEKAQYQPLTRPLFIYINLASAQNNPVMRDFVDFYTEKAPQVVAQVGYVPLPPDGYQLINTHFHRGKVGTVFDGKSEFNITIGELLRKQANF